ncbi:MAG: hypothetical protein KBS46_03765 [Clostridiales bacterium]|nr:hypothetical protein [Candidatus Apopatocola equi]
MPCSAAGVRTGTTEEYRSTWVIYDEAVKGAERIGADGVGFVLQPGMFLLDMDGVDAGSPRVRELLDRFGSYAELSQSGHGIHIYGECNLSQIPTTKREGRMTLSDRYWTRHGDLELYIGGITNRYAAFTGNALMDIPLQDCTDAVLETLERDLKRDEGQPWQTPLTEEEVEGLRDLDAAEVIDALCRQANGEKFRRLFYDGDLTDYGGDQSRADLALCSMIAFRTGDDPALIDAVFRESALYRAKWEREDYRRDTIRKAIEGQRGQFYTPPEEVPYFVIRDRKGHESISKPLLARYVRENLTYILVRDNATQGILTYVYRDGYYQLYAPEMLKGEIRAMIEAYDERLVSMPVINEVYQILLTDMDYHQQDELNEDESLINIENGLLKVTGESTELLPHTPEVLSTIRIPVRWTGEAGDTPVFDSYLQQLSGGNNEVIDFLKEFMGVALSNVKGYRMKKALFLVGPGNTGKSQFKRLLERLLGPENFASIDLSTLEARFGTANAYGKRLVGSADLGYASLRELRVFKQMTGGDSIFAEFKGVQSFFFVYVGLILFAMNELPRFGGDNGDWVYDRIIPLRCENVIPAAMQDKALLDKLYAERDGIFYRAVEALQKVMRNGYAFDEPKCVAKERWEYSRVNNSALTFISECMEAIGEQQHKETCTSGIVYRLYRAWCNDNANGFAKTDREFKSAVADWLLCDEKEVVEHRRGGNYYRELTPTEEIFQRYYGRWN